MTHWAQSDLNINNNNCFFDSLKSTVLSAGALHGRRDARHNASIIEETLASVWQPLEEVQPGVQSVGSRTMRGGAQRKRE